MTTEICKNALFSYNQPYTVYKEGVWIANEKLLGLQYRTHEIGCPGPTAMVNLAVISTCRTYHRCQGAQCHGRARCKCDVACDVTARTDLTGR